MPFDNKGVWRPRVEVLPPTLTPPPEPPRGERPQRVEIHIQINDRGGAPATPRRRPVLTFLAQLMTAIIVLMLLANVAFSQIRYEHWSGPNGSHGEHRSQGTTHDWVDYGPRGERRSCHQYRVGDQPITSCTGSR